MKNQNNWKNQLRKRTITPSDEAWLTIEAGLGNKTANKQKKKYIFSLIAASIIGFIVFLALPSQTIADSKTNTVEAETPTNLIKKATSDPLSLDLNPSIAKSEVIEAKKIQDKSLTSITNQEKWNSLTKPQEVTERKSKIGSKNRVNGNTETDMASIKENAQAVSSEKTKPQVSEKAKQLLLEVEAELASLTTPETSYLPEDEAEALLSEAKLMIQEAEYDKLYQFAKASDLLAEVEASIPKDNLQNRVWSFVKDKAQNLETALASLK